MADYFCARCPKYRKYSKIYFIRELKELVCDSHWESAIKDAEKKKKK